MTNPLLLLKQIDRRVILLTFGLIFVGYLIVNKGAISRHKDKVSFYESEKQRVKLAKETVE